MLYRLSLAFAVATSLAGGAQAYSPASRTDLLPELPAHAPPGECYARVRAPAPSAGPPARVDSARWVLNPGPPGSPGPIWCLVPTGSEPVAAPPMAERYGWVRVLCEADATPARIRGVQKRLHDRGYYRGVANGRYDAATAEAVGRFQSRAHIAHGGYLSVRTLDVLEGQDDDALPPSPPPSAYAQSYGRGDASPPPVYQPPGGPPAQRYADPQAGYPPQVYVQQSYVQQGFSSGYASGYYVGTPPPAYAAAQAQARASAYAYVNGPQPPVYASRSAVQNGWLTWRGKTRY